MKDALEMWIAHADIVHVIKGVADVIDARTAHADALRHQACTAVQVELAHIGRVRGIGDEGEGAHGLVLDLHRNQPRLVDAARHLPVPEPRQRAAQARRIDAVSHAPA
jgi:hypothetical protein